MSTAPFADLGHSTGSTAIVPSEDESKLPGRYGVILKGGLSTVVVDLARSPLKYDEFEKEQPGPQSDAPSGIEPGAPRRRSYLEAIRASNQPFAHRKALFPGEEDDFPPSSPPLPLMRTVLGSYPPKPSKHKKNNRGNFATAPGLCNANFEAHLREKEMEAAIIKEFIECKESQLARLSHDFYGDPRWQALKVERDAWQSQWDHGNLEQRKTAIRHGSPLRHQLRAGRDSVQRGSGPPLQPIMPTDQKSKQWVWNVTGQPHSLRNRVLTPVERPLLEVGPEVLPPNPVVDFPPQGLSTRSSASSVHRVFDMALDNQESMSPADRYEFYKTHGHYAALHYLKHIKAGTEQPPTEETVVPEWFQIFETQNNDLAFSSSETAHGRFADLNFHLGDLGCKVRDSAGESSATKANLDNLMRRIETAQRVVADRDRRVVENRMRAEAARAVTPSTTFHAPGNAMQRIVAERSAENAVHDRANGRPLGSTADEERNDVAKRLDSRRSRLSAHF
ncbi:hypothetical protein PG999_009296 [Apiospora kogelbergensis]|uniref:Uncharacterized protein n=1 Tax=Apiospora kogelbergensis TaxID=1337665 RepID=A0AAW0QKA8_9PEZI